jgi:phosphoglycolate phosphatase
MEHAMIGAVVFDLDGTLLDTLADLADSANAALRLLGFPAHPVDAYRQFVGEGMAELVRRSLPEPARDPAAVERCLAELKREYGRRWSRQTDLYPGIAGLLDALRARRIRLGILSNKADEFTQQMAKHYFGRWVFDAVRGSRPGVPRKPDPAAAIELGAALGHASAATAFVGDSGVDMQTAGGAGMIPVGVLWGFRGADELRANGARHLLATPQELLSLIDAG